MVSIVVANEKAGKDEWLYNLHILITTQLCPQISYLSDVFFKFHY